MISAQISGTTITSNTAGAFSLYEKSRFGEKKRNVIEYSPVEALFLVEQNKMKVYQNKTLLPETQLIKKLKRKDKNIELKLIVFSNLRKKGYIVKTALKFGADFRIYDKGIKPGKEHAKWLLHITKETSLLKWHEFAAKNRVAHSTRKKLLVGVVDEESGITYYEISWIKP